MIEVSKQGVRSGIIFILLLLLSFTAWLPSLLFPLSTLILLSASKMVKSDARLVISIALPFAFLAIAITILGEPTLRYADSDFVAYYNNYLGFLPGKLLEGTTSFIWQGFPWGGGVEVGIPSLHFIFAFVLNAKAPFAVKLLHVLLLEVLLFLALLKVSKKLKLTLQDFVILICLVLVFAKFSGMFNHLRQSYSSLIILMALFSQRKSSRMLLFFLACSFHLSAVVVYPICYWLINSRKNYKSLLILTILFAISVALLLPLFIESLVSGYKNDFIISKLVWSLFRSQEEGSVINSLLTTLTRLAYVIPLLFFPLLTRYWKGEGFQISLFIFLTVFSLYFLPGFAVRVFQIFLIVMLGYLYFRSLELSKYRSTFYYTTIVFFLFIHSTLWFQNSFYFYETSRVNIKPFSFLSLLSKERDVVSRQQLPPIETFIRRTEHQL